MVSLKSILVAVSAVTLAAAQGVKIAFTSIPAVAVAGTTVNITWAGGNGDPVTLTLRKGNPSNLATVDVIADRVTGDSYAWEVSKDLATGSDYALQITQGQQDINYSGAFAIAGGTGTETISYSGITTMTASNSTTSTMSQTVTSDISMGTGTSMIRNMTTPGGYTPTMPPTTTPANSPAASTSSTAPNAANTMGSSAALVMGLFGAIMFLQ